ncbi:hypothetical protein RDWZM_002821 [Blomia tropicalis]|uniref:Uncharacterized protein n=1 Tax=Blomia tropicalis TaxID=40697 RepID=A0A9Q0RSI4_BLOTA|nr:hypothetical protein RDWZM_002821 [Blomia tropicalis]
MSNDPNESDDSTEFEEFQEDDPREMTETEDCTNNYELSTHLPKHGKKVLRAVFREALKKPKSPVVLLLIGSESQKGVISNISQQTLNVFTTGQPHQTLNLKTINIKTSNTGVEIENYFKDALEDNQQSTLLIEDLEQLSTSALLTLHQYINEDESTYKNIFLIFTLKYIDDIKIRDSAEENYFNEIAISLLENLWANSGISKDKIDCIISRINKYLVILLNE